MEAVQMLTIYGTVLSQYFFYKSTLYPFNTIPTNGKEYEITKYVFLYIFKAVFLLFAKKNRN
jgi:hypothetical protein